MGLERLFRSKLVYDERAREVERAFNCFSPLVFAATGGMGTTLQFLGTELVSFFKIIVI